MKHVIIKLRKWNKTIDKVQSNLIDLNKPVNGVELLEFQLKEAKKLDEPKTHASDGMLRFSADRVDFIPE